MPPTKTSTRKSRHQPRRRATSSDSESEVRRAHSSSSDSETDTISTDDEDTPDTPAPALSPRAKKPKDPVIPDQPTSWSELVDQAEGAEPPIIDFADFVQNGVGAIDSSSGPSQPSPSGRARGRGGKRSGGGGGDGKTHRQAYLDKLSEDPSFIPRVGAFWGHDERLLAPELRGMSDWWRGRWNGRGRGARGRGGRPNTNPTPRPDPSEQPKAPTPPPIERTWGHDGFEKMSGRDQDRSAPRGGGRGRGRGRGGRPTPSREPEQLWTKAPDTHLHIDPSTRPQFPGQGKGIKVNLPGQSKPEIVRLPRTQRYVVQQPTRTNAAQVPAEIVVKLPGKPTKVVAPAVQEEPETVQPLEEAPPNPVTRIPAPVPKTALPAQVLNQPSFAHGRTRSQQDAVAFAHVRSPTIPSAPISFGSVDMPALNPGSAPPPETQPLPTVDETTPKILPPASAPLPSLPTPTPPAHTSTPPVGYYNPYAYSTLDGATYYSTATPPPHPHPHMYYPPNGFFVPPRQSAGVTIRAPGPNGMTIHPSGSNPAGPNGAIHPQPRENGQDERQHQPMWNYYPHPAGHNPYYSPSGTPYPGYYPEYAHGHGHGYEYPAHGGVYY
ncbi:hypothetical protein BN14_02206 [Rhizoctonia solani AG-1 IB]|uniref:Btz domain-containing protein n=1 Tax=Thanatephorus cucumeris (strain AG1-IB / isolate 7/3/14) TaxID=1108050 RepID=M5BLA2_THACB|nr:hypothetical protein BN14_02206 [Rhizoctonia solani AG-1 IB]